MSDDLIFVIPDLQIPLQSKGFCDAMAQCIDDNHGRISRVITIGDELDFTSIGRWSDGTPAAYTKALGKERDEWVQVAKDLQVTDTIRSNHTDRLYNSVMRKVPGLLGVPEMELPNFMRLPDLGITFHPKGLRLKDFIFLHGDEAGTSQIAGTTAKNLVNKTGLNVVCGHTHRAGIVPYTTSINGKVTRTLFGIETGHCMDVSKASYVKTHNWQQAWTVLYPTGSTFTPALMPVVKNGFTFEGTRYEW
jgi:hypothetical protein